jgi:hypothetical protein
MYVYFVMFLFCTKSTQNVELLIQNPLVSKYRLCHLMVRICYFLNRIILLIRHLIQPNILGATLSVGHILY